LRTSFHWEEDVIQVIHSRGRLQFYVHETMDVMHLQKEDRQHAFNLNTPTLFRLHVIKHAANHYTLLKTNHHCISDGWSGPILLKQVHEYYNALKQGKKIELSVDKAYESTQAYMSRYYSDAKEHWRTSLAAVRHVNDLSVFLDKRVHLDDIRSLSKACEVSLTIRDGAYHALKMMCQDLGITLNTCVQYAWHKLINTYTRDSQTIVGTTLSGRNLPIAGIDESVGLYINTLPLIIDWRDESIKAQLIMVSERLQKLNEYSFMPLTELQPKGQRLFHSLLVFENYPMPYQRQSIQVEYKKSIEKFDYPFGIIAYETDGALQLCLHFDESLLSKTRAIHYLQQKVLILDQLPKLIEKSHFTINLNTISEYQTIVLNWNQTTKNYPNETLHVLFRHQVKSTPDHIALVFEEKSLTYHALDEQSNQLARLIQKQRPTELIGVCLERSLEMIVSILAILKAGCAYVPMDPKAPITRLHHIVQDIKTNLVLTQHTISCDFGVRRIEVDKGGYLSESSLAIDTNRQPTDLAYVIYTSGTTGLPKGVMVEHRSVVNYSMNVALYFKNIQRVDFSSHLTFDLSVTTSLLPLLLGKTVFIYSGMLENSDNYISHLEKNDIEFVKSTPSYLSQVVASSPNLRIKRCFLGGEKLESGLLARLKRSFAEIYDEYGPTETTIGATLAFKDDKNNGIGRPYHNVVLYILDANQNPIPRGAIGELYIGGAGVARGYLNQPELTEQRFIANPFGEGQLYQTGDLVRYLPQGDLEYLGRTDFQVKIRGFRVELGEIEQVLIQLAQIKQVSVQYLVEPKECLVAYYVSSKAISEQELQMHMEQHLQAYMIPQVYIHIDTLPLTANGKLDRNALPAPEFMSDCYVAPRTELEQQVVLVWQNVLKVARVGIHDDFFKLGGNSILVIQVIARLQEKLNMKLQIADLFHLKTINNILEKHKHSSTANELLVSLSFNSSIKDKIYCIHPRNAHASEAYFSFSPAIRESFNLLGFENYSLLNDHSIETFEALCQYYISQLDLPLDKEESLIFLGWSLGANMALEFAYQLEQKGYTNLQLYLLSGSWKGMSYYSDSDSIKITSARRTLEIRNFMNKGMSKVEALKRVKTMEKIERLTATRQLRTLKHTQAVLFKAMLHEDSAEKLTLNDNGLGHFFSKTLPVIPIQCKHSEMNHKLDEIGAYILSGALA